MTGPDGDKGRFHEESLGKRCVTAVPVSYMSWMMSHIMSHMSHIGTIGPAHPEVP